MVPSREFSLSVKMENSAQALFGLDVAAPLASYCCNEQSKIASEQNRAYGATRSVRPSTVLKSSGTHPWRRRLALWAPMQLSGAVGGAKMSSRRSDPRKARKESHVVVSISGVSQRSPPQLSYRDVRPVDQPVGAFVKSKQEVSGSPSAPKRPARSQYYTEPSRKRASTASRSWASDAAARADRSSPAG